MKNISKFELVFIIIMIGIILFVFYMTLFLLPLHWSLKLLISILLIYFLYLEYIIEHERTNI